MMRSLVIVLPVGQKAAYQAFAATLGQNLEAVVGLSARGLEPATHYGLHAWLPEETAAALDRLPPGLSAVMVSARNAEADPSAHFTEVAGRRHLVPVAAAS